jgi:hypothetical protein
MTITNLVKGWTSPFKPEELAYLLPLDVLDEAMIKTILTWYFPNLKLSDEILMKWSDVRARPFFECLILPLLQKVHEYLPEDAYTIKKSITNNELQEALDENESNYFRNAVDLFLGYIKGSVEHFKIETVNDDSFVNQCWKLYCATLFRDESLTLEPAPATELLSSGFISIKELKSQVRISGPERIPFLALTKFFSSEETGKRVAHNNFESRIIEASISSSANVGYVFEKLNVYLLVSRFCNAKQLLSNAPPFSKCTDKFIDYYVFECTYLLCAKGSTKDDSMEIMKQFLEKRSTTYVLKIPDGGSGPDELFWLRRMTTTEINSAGLPQISNLDNLPDRRLVLAQLSVGTKAPRKVLQNVWLSEVVDKTGAVSEMPKENDLSENGIHCFSKNTIGKKMRGLFQQVLQKNPAMFSGYIGLLIIRDEYPHDSDKFMIPGIDFTPNKDKTFCSITVRDMLDDEELYSRMSLMEKQLAKKESTKKGGKHKDHGSEKRAKKM